MEEQNRNKRIAKNTLFLYGRMVFVMLVSLYTVRVIMANLGIADYGTYNIVGGVVVLFAFITNSSSAATVRYLNYALGENNSNKAHKVFCVSVITHFFVALLVLLLSETAGLWYVNNILVVPEGRLKAANICYQFSIFTTLLGIMNIPYHASVVAHERMSFFALMSIFDCVGKLIIAFGLSIYPYDKLIGYGIFLSIVALLNFLMFRFFVRHNFSICHFKITKDKEIFGELLSFSGWSLLSSFGSVCTTQGLNMILNSFFGVIVNAAMGTANQVNNAVYQLVSSFQTAFEPQIIKSYAAGDREYLLGLIQKTSKFSFYLLWFFVLPLGLNVDIVLKIWLKTVPEYAPVFIRLILIYSLIDAICGPLWMVSYAIGNIRNYQIVAVCMSLITVPLAWVLFKLGLPPYWVIILRLFNNVSFSIYRLFYLKVRMDFPILNFVKKIILPVCLVSIFTFVVSYVAFYFTAFNVVVQFFVSCTVTVLANVFAMYSIGCNKTERDYALSLVKKAMRKVKHK